MNETQINPKLDLTFERVVALSPDVIFKAWTDPKHIVHWFSPAPWKTLSCEIDLVPGGKFRTVMQSPEGQSFPNEGCYLEIVKDRKIVWTSALVAGYRPVPAAPGGFHFTCVVSFQPHDQGTKYLATAMHPDETSRKEHEKMGFKEGWGKALDQLIAHMTK